MSRLDCYFRLYYRRWYGMRLELFADSEDALARATALYSEYPGISLTLIERMPDFGETEAV